MVQLLLFEMMGTERRKNISTFHEMGLICWNGSTNRSNSGENDAAASSFVNHLHRKGVCVPEDVSVIGYDDTSMERNALVTLTSISHPAQVIADSVVELILSRIEKRYSGPARLVEVKAAIIERESVKNVSDSAS
jgi:hypothetical protein